MQSIRFRNLNMQLSYLLQNWSQQEQDPLFLENKGVFKYINSTHGTINLSFLIGWYNLKYQVEDWDLSIIF